MYHNLNSAEQLTFHLVSQILTAKKEIDRNELRVIVVSHGGELGRVFLSLKEKGLLQEREIVPGYFQRLLGAPSRRTVRLTEHGRALAQHIVDQRSWASH